MATATTLGTELDVRSGDEPDDRDHGGLGAALVTAARFAGNLAVACAAVLGLGGADDY